MAERLRLLPALIEGRPLAQAADRTTRVWATPWTHVVARKRQGRSAGQALGSDRWTSRQRPCNGGRCPEGWTL